MGTKGSGCRLVSCHTLHQACSDKAGMPRTGIGTLRGASFGAAGPTRIFFCRQAATVQRDSPKRWPTSRPAPWRSTISPSPLQAPPPLTALSQQGRRRAHGRNRLWQVSDSALCSGESKPHFCCTTGSASHAATDWDWDRIRSGPLSSRKHVHVTRLLATPAERSQRVCDPAAAANVPRDCSAAGLPCFEAAMGLGRVCQEGLHLQAAVAALAALSRS